MKQLFLYTTRRVFAPLIILVLTLPASVTIGLAAEQSGQHGLSIYGAPRYPQDFKHFDYVNPNAPKGGVMTQGSFGTYDSLNPFILPGNSAAGLGLIYDTLMEKGQNEAFGEYGLLAKTIRVSPSGARNPIVTFNLQENAKFSDGKPVTAEDVVFTFNLLIKDGSPLYRSYYADVKSVRAVGKDRVVFYLANGENKELPLILGQLMVLPKHYWKGKDFTKVSLDIPIGSGPYRLAERNPGRSLTYKRNPDYWGKDLPVNKGRHNFDEMRYVYYRDLSIVHEAFKAGKIDVKVENQANRWKTGYNFPAVKNGKVIAKEFPHQRNQGMQAFVFNTRQPMFASPRVREALNYAFNFEWTNKNLFHSSYTRSDSFFSNSELAARGLPTGDELSILNAYRDQLPSRLFTQPPPAVRSNGKGISRSNLRTALKILAEAGWQLKDGKLIKAGKQMKIEILLVQKGFERIVNPFVQNLERLGIDARMRLVDTSQYIKRLQEFDFDMVVFTFAQSESPGNEQRDFWSSASAVRPGSRNLAGIKDPVADELVEKLILAQTRKDLVSWTRALDRVLLWGFYVIPQWHISADRVAYWDKFGTPAKIPLSGVQTDTWWVKEADKETGKKNKPKNK